MLFAVQLYTGQNPASSEMSSVEVTEKLMDAMAATAAALATPPPEPPTDEELNALWNCCGDHDEGGGHYGNIFQFARAVLERWGNG
jgi:hypothetical protein